MPKMVSQQILTTVMTRIVVDKSTLTRAAWTLFNNGKLGKQISSICGKM